MRALRSESRSKLSDPLVVLTCRDFRPVCAHRYRLDTSLSIAFVEVLARGPIKFERNLRVRGKFERLRITIQMLDFSAFSKVRRKQSGGPQCQSATFSPQVSPSPRPA